MFVCVFVTTGGTGLSCDDVLCSQVATGDPSHLLSESNVHMACFSYQNLSISSMANRSLSGSSLKEY